MSDAYSKPGRLTRPIQSVPADVLDRLVAAGLINDYHQRPPYQRNDYLAWIGRAKHADTRARRVNQMLSELRTSGVYMGMKHPPSLRPAPPDD